MNTTIIKITCVLLISLLGIRQGLGQHFGNLYLGIAPDVTVERDYEKGEFDVNILPIVVQYYLGNYVALRAASTINLHVKDGSQVSHVGGQIAAPVYFLGGAESFVTGFYLAPVFGLRHIF